VEHPAPAEPPATIVSDPHELPELEVAKYLNDEGLTSEFRDYQKRVIVFHSGPFTRDVEVTGQMKLKLIVQSDAADFDLWAQILMIQPDGSTIHLGEDIRPARFRNSFFKQELLKPDQIVEIPFEFFWMARRIAAGARLRLTMAPLNSAAYQRQDWLREAGGRSRGARQSLPRRRTR
jgi:predicted acyl esterase